VFIAFDTAHDHQNAYVFEVNASGVQNDYLQVGDTGTNNDYEAVWEVATLQTDQGWNAEFRIPLLRWEYVRGSTLFAVWNLARRRKTREKASTHRGVTFAVRSAPREPIPSRSN
jgi:hypothetical protein